MGLQVAGRGGVPATGAAAVLLNVTVTNPSSRGFLTVFPGGTARPTASNLNFAPGQTVPNRVSVALGSGQVSLYNFAGSANVVVDVGGWFTDATAGGHGSRFVAITPQRILDTRDGFGPIPQGGIATTQIADPAQIGISAVVLNATVTDPTASSYLVLWPNGSARPVASDLNYVAGDTVPNLVVAKLGTNQAFEFYNLFGSTSLVFDLVGYYGPVV